MNKKYTILIGLLSIVNLLFAQTYDANDSTVIQTIRTTNFSGATGLNWNDPDPGNWLGVVWDTTVSPRRIVELILRDNGVSGGNNTNGQSSFTQITYTDPTWLWDNGPGVTTALVGDLDLTALTELTGLHLGRNPINSVNLAGLNKLEHFRGPRMDSIRSIDLSGLASLKSVRMPRCGKLNTFNASNCPNLTRVKISWATDSLVNVNVSGCTNLEQLNLKESPAMTSVDLTGISTVKRLAVSNRSIGNGSLSTITNLAANTDMRKISLSGNKLSGNMDFSTMDSIQRFSLRLNSVESITGIDSSRAILDGLRAEDNRLTLTNAVQVAYHTILGDQSLRMTPQMNDGATILYTDMLDYSAHASINVNGTPTASSFSLFGHASGLISTNATGMFSFVAADTNDTYYVDMVNSGITVTTDTIFVLGSLPVAYVSITDIQTPGGGSDSSLYKGSAVTTGGIVTAVKTGTGYWIQESNGGPYSGVYVYDSLSSTMVTEGDSVLVDGTIDEYFGCTQVEAVTSTTVVSSGNAYVTTNLTTNAVNDEQWEGVMVMVDTATCTSTPNGFGEWQVNDGSGDVQVDDFLYQYNPTLSTVYNVTGVVNYSFGSYEVFPRFIADIDSLGADTTPAGFKTITMIQTPAGGSGDSPYRDSIITTGGIVTAIKSGTGFWIQESTGGPYSGVYVYDSLSSTMVTEGDSVIVDGTVDEFFSCTQIESVTNTTVISSGNTYVITPLSTNAVSDEQWEGVMIMVDTATCNATPNGFGEWYVNDGSGDMQIDDFMYSYTPSVSTQYNVTGVVNYSFSSYEVFPRYIADIDSIGQGDLNLDTVTIPQIQTPLGASGDSPYMDSTVTTTGIVTAVKAGSGYYIQVAAGGPYSGLYVYDPSNTPAEGDELVVTGKVVEFFNLTELTSVSLYAVVSTGNAFTTTELSTNDVNNEAYEGVLVKVTQATCNADTNQYGEWQVNDGTGVAVVNDFMYVYGPTIDEVYNVTGVVDYNFSEYKINPRYAADVELYTDPGGIANGINNLNIFPNPAGQSINVTIENMSTSNIKVVDITGKVRKSVTTNELNTNISLEDLETGLYFIEVSYGNSIERVKFIKK